MDEHEGIEGQEADPKEVPASGAAGGAQEGDEPEATDAEQAEATDAGEAESQSEVARELAELREERAQLRAEREAYQQRADERERATPPTAAPASYEQQLAREVARLQTEMDKNSRDLDALAERDDPVAKQAVLLAQAQRVQLEATFQQIRSMKDDAYERVNFTEPDERRAWATFKSANSHLFLNIEAAHLAFEGHRAREAKASLAAREKKADAIIKAKERGVLGTVTRDVRAKDSPAKGKEMDEDMFDRKVEELHAAGRHDEARALQGRYDSGDLRLVTSKKTSAA